MTDRDLDGDLTHDEQLPHFDKLAAYFSPPVGHHPLANRCLRYDGEGAVGLFGDLRLRSAFQPLFARTTMQAIAFEALLRTRDGHGRPVSPELAFKVPTMPEDVVFLDRICRTVHAINFVNQAQADDLLFLNIDGRHLQTQDSGSHGTAFETLLTFCGLKPAQVVLEILESRIDDVARLQAAVTAYQQRGFRIAIDDFGCEDSNFDRLWRIAPDIVKIDRSLLVQSEINPRAKRMLPKLVEIIQDLGALAVCEGIETANQHGLAVDAGVDYLQGYFYARPTPQLQRAASMGREIGEPTPPLN